MRIGFSVATDKGEKDRYDDDGGIGIGRDASMYGEGRRKERRKSMNSERKGAMRFIKCRCDPAGGGGRIVAGKGEESKEGGNDDVTERYRS